VVIDPSLALRQLCAADADAGPIAYDATRPLKSTCEEGQRYRCIVGALADCAAGRTIATCIRGCVAEGAAIDDDGVPVRREAAFAILCSR
jgi:hypothetical protein